MTFGLDQPAVIRTEVSDIVQFWQRGVHAARVHLTYAVEAVKGGVAQVDDFIDIFSAQQRLFDLLEREQSELRPVDITPDPLDGYLLSTFHHNLFDNEKHTLKMIGSTKGSATIFDKVAKFYAFPFALGQLLLGLAETFFIVAESKDIGTEIKTAAKLVFADPATEILARQIFGNVINNSFKYGTQHGKLTITQTGDTITFADDGIGMDPKFAASLGRGEQLRECRADGVQGDGIGWKSIGEMTADLSWTWAIETALGQGTKIIFNMKPGDLVAPDAGMLLGASNLLGGSGAVSTADILATLSVFKDAKPWDGYRLTRDIDFVDISATPTFKAIQQARVLMERLERRGGK